FLTNFDVIIIPPFNGSAMSHHLNQKINSKMIHKILTWSYSQFCEHLIFKTKELIAMILSNTIWMEARCSGVMNVES
ncbi:4413_t:CDS:2, partial [Cetraspora pellucida]